MMKRFLSQTEIPLVRALKLGLGDLYRMHQWIWKMLPEDGGAKRDFLFRSDSGEGKMRILLLSEREPMPVEEAAWKVTSLSDTFLSHREYRFKVKVNPTYRRAEDHRRLAIFGEEKIREWAVRKFAAAGCEAIEMELTAPRRVQFKKNGKTGTVVSADITGRLRVTDGAKFREGFDCGIGSAKGFGHGMLMLQPVFNQSMTN